VGGWSVDHHEVRYEFERRGVEQAYADYFAWETDLAASGTVDVLAHADVVKKHGYRLDPPPLDLYRTLAAATAGTGTAVEVSTAGRYTPAGEMYPASQLLAAMHDAGVPITLASDAHVPGDAARDRSLAIAYAKEHGYAERARFTRRVRELVPLES
jgi:histidinol-phosphatase (PHP family)